MITAHSTNYQDTFIAVAEDSTASAGVAPPPRPTPSVAELTFSMIAENPYRYTSDDVIFTVWADRRAIEDDVRPTARAEFFSKGQPCLRSSDLGKRYGWGVHSDADGRVAVFALGSAEYTMLEQGRSPAGGAVAVTRAMRSSRADR